MNRRKLASLMAASALIIGMFGLSAGTVVASDGQVWWTGNGTSDGKLGDVKCDESNTPYLYWVFNPGGQDAVTAASITFGGTGTGTFDMTQVSAEGTWKLEDGPWFDLVGLTAVVDYTGSLGNGNAVVTISHGCPGSTTTTTTTTTTSATTTSATTTTTATFTGGTGAETDVPTEPNTAAVGQGGPSAPSNGAWLLVLALGGLLASIVILTPAGDRKRR